MNWSACRLSNLFSVLLPAWVVLGAGFVPRTAQAADDPAEAATVDGIAAYVNEDAITISDVQGGVRMFLNDPEWRSGRTREEAFRAAFAEALGQRINQCLIVQAYRAGEARLPDWLIEKRLTEILDSRFQGDHSALLRELSSERMTLEDWRQRVEEQMIVAAMRQSQVQANVRVTPSQILTYYREHAERYQQPAAVHLGLIFIKARSGETEEAYGQRVRAVSERLADGESFESVAREVSDDPSSEKGGDWGWVTPAATLRAELVEALSALGVGEVSAPVSTASGTYFLRKQGARAEGSKPLEEVRDEIEREIAHAESERLFLGWMLRLRSRASIRTFVDFLQPAATP